MLSCYNTIFSYYNYYNYIYYYINIIIIKELRCSKILRIFLLQAYYNLLQGGISAFRLIALILVFAQDCAVRALFAFLGKMYSGDFKRAGRGQCVAKSKESFNRGGLPFAPACLLSVCV